MKLDDVELFQFKLRQTGAGAGTRMFNFTKPITDLGNFYTGVILLDSYVVKLMSDDSHNCFRFELPPHAAQAQRDHEKKSTHDWLGSSSSIPRAKILEEIAHMKHMHALSLGPALHCAMAYNGIIILIITSILT